MTQILEHEYETARRLPPDVPRPITLPGWLVVLVGGLVIVGIAGFVVEPLLWSPYESDDIGNSQIPMILQASGQSMWEYIRVQNDYWTSTVGRFFPSSAVQTTLVFTIFSTRAAYKVWQFAMVLGNVALLQVFVWRLTRNVRMALLVGLLFAATLQMRWFHDPILHFSTQQQILVGLVLGSLLAAHLALVRRRARWLLLTALLWAMALTTYETAYVLFPAFALLLLATRTRWAERRWLAAAVLGPLLILGLYVASLRSHVETDHPGYTSDLTPARVIPTAVEQITSALPLSYTLFGRPENLPPEVPDRIEPLHRAWSPSAGDVAVGAAVLVLFVGLTGQLRIERRRELLAMGGIGLILWLAPAALIAIVRRWQETLEPGVGYVPVYVSYVGVALLATALTAWAASALLRKAGHRRARRLVAILAGLGLAGIVLVTADNNDRVVRMFSGTGEQREVFERAIERGLFAEVPAGSLVLTPDVRWVNSEFIGWFGGPPVVVDNQAASSGRIDPCPTGPDDGTCWATSTSSSYVLEHGRALALSGRPGIAPSSTVDRWARLAPVDGVAEPDSGGTVAVRAATALLYVEDDALDGDATSAGVRITAPVVPVGGSEADAHERQIADEEIRVIAHGPGWRLLEIRLVEGELLGAELTVVPGEV